METPETPESARMAQIRDSIDVLIRTRRLHHRVVERRIEGLGVHHSQHRLLMKLSKLGTSASQKDLAEAMDVSPACVARALKQMAAARLIDRADGADGRCKAISILPEGTRLVEDSLAVFRQIGAEMYEGIGEAELAAFTATMRRIQNNLSAMEQRDTLSEGKDSSQ